jgi:glycosyltransferase involved in cell wall biosynthesis
LLDNVRVITTPRSHDEIKGLLNDCLAYISPSSEVNPVLVMEAWAARRPVIALNVDGNKEVIETTQSLGGLVYNGTADLHECIKGAIEFGAEMGRAGRETVEEFFDWRELAWQTFQVYKTRALPSREGRLRAELATTTSQSLSA